MRNYYYKSIKGIIIITLNKEDGDKLEDDHKRDKKVRLMIVVRLVGTMVMVDFLTRAL